MLCAYFWQTSLEPKFKDDPALRRAVIGMHNAAIESTLISIRAFDDFCRNKREHQDDLLAGDFPELSIETRFLDLTDRRRINKQVAHLTHVSVGQAESSYHYREFLSAALPRARQFCHYCESDTVSPDAQLAAFVRETLNVIQSVEAHYIKRI
jgi:hypothetical protein